MTTESTRTGWGWLARFFASFSDVPTTGLHAATAALLAVVYTVTLVIALARRALIDDAVAVTVGTFILGYLTKTSYDFHKKRTTDADTMVARTLAESATPPTTVAVHDKTVTATKPAQVAVLRSPAEQASADIAHALRTGTSGKPPKAETEGLG